jgi:hypothetical protein
MESVVLVYPPLYTLFLQCDVTIDGDLQYLTPFWSHYIIDVYGRDGHPRRACNPELGSMPHGPYGKAAACADAASV